MTDDGRPRYPRSTLNRPPETTQAPDFDAIELGEVRDPADTSRTIDSANDLTLGESLRLLENPEHWTRVGWPVDRAEFVKALVEIKEIRNDVMHFNPDPLSQSQRRLLRNFVGWLRSMEPID